MLGKRDCLGKSLALTEFYLFFTALMQRYNFRWIDEDNLDELSTRAEVGFTRGPPAFEVVVTKRK